MRRCLTPVARLAGSIPTSKAPGFTSVSTTRRRRMPDIMSSLTADGHAKWLRPFAVSAGQTPVLATCNQNNIPAVSGCDTGDPAIGPSWVAGTSGLFSDGGKPSVTFSYN